MTEKGNIARPVLLPLGDNALLVRFGDRLTEAANIAAIHFARGRAIRLIPGVLEVAPNLVSVLLRYDPRLTSFDALAAEVRLALAAAATEEMPSRYWRVPVRFDGPDIEEVAESLGMNRKGLIEAHNAAALRVLATGFAPGFVYCGLHPPELVVPRRTTVRPAVAAGSVLFAAGQTAVTSTEVPTGWHVIGSTSFRNFDASREPPCLMTAGDVVQFEEEW